MSYTLLRALVVMRRGPVADNTMQGSGIGEIPLYYSAVHFLINIRRNNTQEGEAKRGKRKQTTHFQWGKKISVQRDSSMHLSSSASALNESASIPDHIIFVLYKSL